MKMQNTVKVRRSHTAHFKAQIVIAGMTKKLSISQLCKRNGISESLYYIWKQRFISAGTIGLERQNRRAPKPAPSSNAVELQDMELAKLETNLLNSRKALMACSKRTSEAEKLLILKLVGSAKTSKRAALKRIGVHGQLITGGLISYERQGHFSPVSGSQIIAGLPSVTI